MGIAGTLLLLLATTGQGDGGVLSTPPLVDADEPASQTGAAHDAGAGEIDALSAACDADQAEACFELGRAFVHGNDVRKDEAAALTAFDRACRLGRIEACRGATRLRAAAREATSRHDEAGAGRALSADDSEAAARSSGEDHEPERRRAPVGSRSGGVDWGVNAFLAGGLSSLGDSVAPEMAASVGPTIWTGDPGSFGFVLAPALGGSLLVGQQRFRGSLDATIAVGFGRYDLRYESPFVLGYGYFLFGGGGVALGDGVSPGWRAGLRIRLPPGGFYSVPQHRVGEHQGDSESAGLRALNPSHWGTDPRTYLLAPIWMPVAAIFMLFNIYEVSFGQVVYPQGPQQVITVRAGWGF
ncbi:MAG: hypothetical protein ACYC8T_15025 [Myxococcaceae bacterium]